MEAEDTVTEKHPKASAVDADRAGECATPALVITADSLPWRRRLGSLAWTALQQLALSSHHTEQGWAAPVGVRDVAQGLRVTKDTAARAVSTLVTAGLVTRNRVEMPGRRRRPGYILHLPAPMWLIGDPMYLDGIRDERADCLNGEYSTRGLEDARCPGGQYSPDLKAAGKGRQDPAAARWASGIQPELFEEASRPGAVVDLETRQRSS